MFIGILITVIIFSLAFGALGSIGQKVLWGIGVLFISLACIDFIRYIMGLEVFLWAL